MIDVVCAIISKNGKVLAAQNSPDTDHPLKWEFPGGKIDPGETYQAAIIREIDEELKLKVEVIQQLKNITYDYGIKQIRLIPLICKIVSGTIKLAEHLQVGWFAWEELNMLDFSEADHKLLKAETNRNFLLKYLGENMNQGG